MKNLSRIASILLHTLFLIVVYLLQGVVFPFIRLEGLVPLLLPVATAGIALYEGRYIGGISGLFAGILCDISFNEPAGTFTVVLTLVGLGVGILSETVFLPGFATYLLTSFAVLVISAFVQMVPLVMIQTIPVSVLLTTAMGQTIYSMVLAVPIWFFVRALGRRADRGPYFARTKEEQRKLRIQKNERK